MISCGKNVMLGWCKFGCHIRAGSGDSAAKIVRLSIGRLVGASPCSGNKKEGASLVNL